jgi:Na+-transporting NADH:ubiquinone oxidoreductase subunit NqrD
MKMVKSKLSFVLACAVAGAMGAANAEPLALNDSQMDGVAAGIGFTSATNITKLVQIQELIQEQKLALFNVFTEVQGYSAVAEAEADAEGPNADAQTFTFAEVVPTTNFFKVNSLAKSIALVDPRPIPARP